MSEGKADMTAFSALCLTQPCFSVFTTTPNNWREWLMGQVPTLGTPFRGKEITVKREQRETERGGSQTPHHIRGTRKSSPDRAEKQSPLVTRFMKNTVITVVHTLKPSSLAYSLQVHCTGLTDLRSQVSWAWPEKRDPTKRIM